MSRSGCLPKPASDEVLARPLVWPSPSPTRSLLEPRTGAGEGAGRTGERESRCPSEEKSTAEAVAAHEPELKC